jgi:hypothetical protein
VSVVANGAEAQAARNNEKQPGHNQRLTSGL